MINIMMVDDDEDDRMMFQEVVESMRLLCKISFAIDGQDLMDQLNVASAESLPDLILLDLNMPRKDGREALEEIKQDIHFKMIPVVILTTSTAEEDIIKAYGIGASSFISKPVTFDGLQKKIVSLTDYWFDVVKLPPKKSEYYDGF